MHVVVIGAGIAGTVTALTLARAGCTVDIVEAAASPATGASFANAGLVSPGHCFSWAEPGVGRAALNALWDRRAGMSFCPPWTPAFLRWAWLFLREGNWASWQANSAAALALSAYSRDLQFHDNLVAPDCYGGRQAGIVYLYGADDQPGPYDQALLQAAGEPFRALDGDGLLQCEPLLRLARLSFAKGVFSPKDGTGDAARYARAALAQAEQLGVRSHFQEPVHSLRIEGDVVLGVQTQRQWLPADAVIMCAGLASRQLLLPAGYRLPIHPVTGYSLSYAMPAGAVPRVGAVSIPHKVAWAAFGEETVRFTGFADIGVPGPRLVRQRLADLQAFAAAVLPSTVPLQPAQWVGQRPMTPDNLPFLGESHHRNLWFNCGHGAMGWTMACGSARIVTDLLAGRRPAIDPTPYRWDRYHRLRRRVPRSAVTATVVASQRNT